MVDSIQELEREISLLRSRCQVFELENHQKDLEIAELKKAHSNLRDMKRSASVHSFHPNMVLDGLPEEFVAVKKGLKETAERCQQLLVHLDQFSRVKSPVEVKNRDFQTQTSLPEGLEQHTSGLRTTVDELSRKLNNWRESHIFHTQAIQHETFQDAIARYHEAQNEMDLLRIENHRLREEANKLRDILENVTAVYTSEDAAAKESILILKEQTLAYSEDFRNERRDREAAQGRVADLEAEVAGLKKMIQSYETRQMEDIRRRRDEALERYRREYQQTHPNASVYQTDSNVEFGEDLGEDTVDCGSKVEPMSVEKSV